MGNRIANFTYLLCKLSKMEMIVLFTPANYIATGTRHFLALFSEHKILAVAVFLCQKNNN